MIEALIALVATLVAAQIAVVKRMCSRGDDAAAKRDEHMTILIGGLVKGVEVFERFEVESQGHMKILHQRLETITQTQLQILQILQDMKKKDYSHD